jgi:hypothetical protein
VTARNVQNRAEASLSESRRLTYLQNDCKYHSKQSDEAFIVLILLAQLKISPTGQNDKSGDRRQAAARQYRPAEEKQHGHRQSRALAVQMEHHPRKGEPDAVEPQALHKERIHCREKMII